MRACGGGGGAQAGKFGGGGFLGAEAHIGAQDKLSTAVAELGEKYERINAAKAAEAAAKAAADRAECAACAAAVVEGRDVDLTEDDEFMRLREARMKALRETTTSKKAHLALGHGEYRCVRVVWVDGGGGGGGRGRGGGRPPGRTGAVVVGGVQGDCRERVLGRGDEE